MSYKSETIKNYKYIRNLIHMPKIIHIKSINDSYDRIDEPIFLNYVIDDYNKWSIEKPRHISNDAWYIRLMESKKKNNK